MTERTSLMASAWDELQKSVIFYRGEPVGTVAARDPEVDALNYDQVFTPMATPEQSAAIMGLLERRWDDLVGAMPMKLCFPALEGRDWRTLTGADAKNVPWSYHNGGNWPFLLRLLAAAAIRAGRPGIAQRALDVAAARIAEQRWPEFYNGRDGRPVGKEARAFQTWSIAGFIAGQEMLATPEHVNLFTFEESGAVSACSSKVADGIVQVPQG
jgi:hypothetical protein